MWQYLMPRRTALTQNTPPPRPIPRLCQPAGDSQDSTCLPPWLRGALSLLGRAPCMILSHPLHSPFVSRRGSGPSSCPFQQGPPTVCLWWDPVLTAAFPSVSDRGEGSVLSLCQWLYYHGDCFLLGGTVTRLSDLAGVSAWFCRMGGLLGLQASPYSSLEPCRGNLKSWGPWCHPDVSQDLLGQVAQEHGPSPSLFYPSRQCWRVADRQSPAFRAHSLPKPDRRGACG